MDICRKITGIENKNGYALIHTNSCDIKIVFVTDEIVRVRASFDKEKVTLTPAGNEGETVSGFLAQL